MKQKHKLDNQKNNYIKLIAVIHSCFYHFSNFIYFLASISLGLISLTMIFLATKNIAIHMIHNNITTEEILNSVSYIIISIAIFDVGKSFLEEELIRDKELRSASEARKTLTKFIVVIIIAMSLEALIYVFVTGKQKMEHLIYPCILMLTSAITMVCLAVYQKISASTEIKLDSQPD